MSNVFGNDGVAAVGGISVDSIAQMVAQMAVDSISGRDVSITAGNTIDSLGAVVVVPAAVFTIPANTTQYICITAASTLVMEAAISVGNQAIWQFEATTDVIISANDLRYNFSGIPTVAAFLTKGGVDYLTSSIAAAADGAVSSAAASAATATAQAVISTNAAIDSAAALAANEAFALASEASAIAAAASEVASAANASMTADHIADAVDAHAASAIAFTPAGDLVSANMQAVAAELDADKVPRTSLTGSAILPTGTTAQRDVTPVAGYTRFNSDTSALESWYSAAWNTIATTANSMLLTGDQTVAGVKTFSSPVGVAAAAAAGDAVRKDQLTDKIQPITASVGANALTATLNPTTLDFRDATLTSGNVNTRIVSTAINCVVPSTATLGTVNAVQSDIVLLAIDNAGTVELAVVNLAGGNDLSETGLISTTALSAGSDSANVIYSTTARTNVPYRVVGIVRSTQATAGTWATAPSLIQGSGGQAITAMSSLGYGQTWQNLTASRAAGTTYYNTTGRPIEVAIQLGGAGLTCTLSIDGAAVVGGYASPSANATLCAVVPSGKSYSVNAGALVIWSELR